MVHVMAVCMHCQVGSRVPSQRKSQVNRGKSSEAQRLPSLEPSMGTQTWGLSGESLGGGSYVSLTVEWDPPT